VEDAARTGAASVRVSFSDRFTVDRPPGTVVGSVGPTGALRSGVDAEGRISIDNGALRLRPLQRPGWGREGISYGPFRRVPGLTMAARVLNGHNSSQTFYFPESRRQRLRRVVRDARRLQFGRPLHFENLAVGWFAEEAPADPIATGNALVMHAANRDNGELWAGVEHQPLRAAIGIQNLDIVYVVVLQARGATYLAMTTPGAVGLGDEPLLRPLAVDRADRIEHLYAGVHQRILGEVGYRVDSRVSAVCAEVVDAWSAWYGPAAVADRLTGSGDVAGSEAEIGGRWQERNGRLHRTSAGCRGPGEAVVTAPGPIGLVHAVVGSSDRGSTAALLFRVRAGHGWLARLGPSGTTLVRLTNGLEETVATATGVRLRPNEFRSVQITDDGESIGLHVDGRLVFERWIADQRGGPSPIVGVSLAGGAVLRYFEAHPLQVQFPDVLDVGPTWTIAGETLVIDERFDAESPDLHGQVTPTGRRRWERTLGPGGIELPGGGGARVRATRDEPNPDRTAYTVAWPDPRCADVEIELIPPGTARHEGENCRVGVVFWQDEDNYLIVNVFLDDVYDGSSVSTFYHLGGHEDMYDAVWSLVWPVLWGRPCRLRVAFDGQRFLAWHEGRPVLQRALTDVYPTTPRIEIRRIGIIVNEEWGNDTGTRVTSFRASRSGGAS